LFIFSGGTGDGSTHPTGKLTLAAKLTQMQTKTKPIQTKNGALPLFAPCFTLTICGLM
jgi:hypothetical protein